jgi:hypothetical protein
MLNVRNEINEGLHSKVLKDRSWPLCRAMHNGQFLPITTGRFMAMNMAE